MENTIYYRDHYNGREMKLVFGDRLSEIVRNVITHLINGAIAFVKEEGQISINREYDPSQDEKIKEVATTAFVMDDVVAIVNTEDGADFINRVDACFIDVVESDETEKETVPEEIPTEEVPAEE